MTIRRIVGALGTAALALSLIAPAAAAADLEPMGPRMLEQTVLRVQFPKTLGAWQQYMYSTIADQAPTVCGGAKGPIRLPKAPVVGLVNYQVDLATNGAVSIYQYDTEAQAAQALAALQKADCTARPKVPTESETYATGSQSFDQFTDTSLASLVTYIEPGENIRGYVSTLSTQRGLAVIQTQVGAYRPLPQSVTQQRKALDRVAGVNDRWHAKVVKAYQNFGVEDTAR
jgi:hypothetical protein